MILGIGLDIIEIERIAKSCVSKAFMQKVFTPSELELFGSTEKSIDSIAGNFAAKEAIMKAFGVGFSSGFYRDISVLRRKSGQPYVVLTGPAKQHFDTLGATNLHVSITHNRSVACAQAILEA